MSADQIEQYLSRQAAQLMRAAIMIARAIAVREADARRAAARASLEHARALRTVTEQQRRLAAPIYRAARRDGCGTTPRSAPQKEHEQSALPSASRTSTRMHEQSRRKHIGAWKPRPVPDRLPRHELARNPATHNHSETSVRMSSLT